MRRNTLVSPQQRALPFARHEIWQSIPRQPQQQCRALCEELVRAVLRHEERTRREEEDDRKDSRRTS